MHISLATMSFDQHSSFRILFYSTFVGEYHILPLTCIPWFVRLTPRKSLPPVYITGQRFSCTNVIVPAETFLSSGILSKRSLADKKGFLLMDTKIRLSSLLVRIRGRPELFLFFKGIPFEYFCQMLQTLVLVIPSAPNTSRRLQPLCIKSIIIFFWLISIFPISKKMDRGFSTPFLFFINFYFILIYILMYIIYSLTFLTFCNVFDKFKFVYKYKNLVV